MAMMIDYEKMKDHVRSHRYPLVFATISGAHLYGFPSPDSDFDLRGTHMLPWETVVGLDDGEQTVEKEGVYDGLEIDLVTHDIEKFFRLMLRKNGYVLEQVFSPLVVHTTDAHDELLEIARECVTKHHAHHYLGFAASQWKLFQKEAQPRVKPLLYVYRVLLTGIHLMRTGEVEANLVTLNHEFGLGFLEELIAKKLEGPEQATISESDGEFYESEYVRLVGELEHARDVSTVRETTTAHKALHDLLVRLRRESFQA